MTTMPHDDPAAVRRDSDGAGKRILPWLVAVAFFMESLDTTILNTAVPTIAAALGVVPLSIKSVLSSYTLSLAVFIPISGWMADRFGTRRVFATAIAIFTLGSLLSGLATSIQMLVACRLLQGLGGAMMMPVGRITMVRTFAKHELIRAMTFVAIPGLIGPMLGPVVGGLIVKYLHWSMLFFVNIPIGLLGLWLVHRHLPDYRAAVARRLDVAGFVLFGGGVALLSYVLEVFGEHRLSATPLIVMLVMSLAMLVAYGVRATRTAHPLLRLALFRIRTFRTAVSGSFFTRLGIGGMPFLFPLLYQLGLGYSPVQSGLLMMPQAIAAMSLKVAMPRILSRFGYRTVLLSNTAILGALIMLFATVGPGTTPWRIVPMVFMYGFLASLQYSSMNTLVYADVLPDETSSASTIASTGQQLSISFGIAAASLVTAIFIPDRVQTDAAGMIRGIHKGFLVLGALTMVSATMFLWLRQGDGEAPSKRDLRDGARTMLSDPLIGRPWCLTPRSSLLQTCSHSQRHPALEDCRTPQHTCRSHPPVTERNSNVTYLNLRDLESIASETMPHAAYDYYAGGAGDEITVRENEAAWSRRRIVPRVLVDVSHCDLSTTVLGTPITMPILTAPCALNRLAHDDGELAVARAVAAEGTIQVLSTLSSMSLEAVAREAVAPRWFQLYVYRDRGITQELVRRAEASGYTAICLTVDVPRPGNRERDIRNGFKVPHTIEAANFGHAIADAGSGSALLQYIHDQFDPSLTWEGLAWLRSITTLPIVVKGVLSPLDAQRCIDTGAEGIGVSNHGGRQLDTVMSSCDALEDIADVVQGRAELFVDGGIRRGTDVLKALALGANAVLIGRPYLWGLAVDGERGVRRVLGMLRDDLALSMALAGTSSVRAIRGPLLASHTDHRRPC